MPDFYACPLTTAQDPGQRFPRRSKTKEYRKLVAEPLKAGKLDATGYRWAVYLYGGETEIQRAQVTATRYDSNLNRRQGDCEAFRDTLDEDGYNGLPDREVEYNIFVPQDLLQDFPIGRRITESEAKTFLAVYPIPCWIKRDSPLYSGWQLCNKTWEGGQTLEELTDNT